ncbi:MAG: pilus assembly PilX N-terminal domain-containing protein [Acidobacteria bacterium]|nr:pilus assembly PilX N-terminal domain-containing protein [Acidobacteriota bacterium]
MGNEKGTILLMAAMVAVLLSLLGLSATLSSLGEYSLGNEYEVHEKALQVADAGFNQVKNYLRGKDLTPLLATTTSVPVYVATIEAQAGTFAFRNPLTPLEARNVDFYSTPSGSRTVKGLLTPATGATLGSGRYFAKLSDNRDEEELGLTNDPDVDLDGKLYLRVMGLERTAPAEQSSYGSTIKNAVSIIEALIKRDTSFDVGSPFALYGPNVNPASSNMFDGNAFLIDGYDHSGWANDDITRNHGHPQQSEEEPAIALINDNQMGGDATSATSDVYNSLSPQQYNNLEGAAGPYGTTPSLQDITTEIRNSPDEDATNIFDANFVANFVKKVKAVADYSYNQDTTLSGSNIQLGTEADPRITVVNGNLTISGGGSGAGILVVTGALNYQGSFDYKGVILVVGTGEAEFGGANKSLVGGIYISKLIDDGNGQYTFGNPAVTLSGNSNFYFKSENVRMGLSLLPLKTLTWREITPEIEPAE